MGGKGINFSSLGKEKNGKIGKMVYRIKVIMADVSDGQNISISPGLN